MAVAPSRAWASSDVKGDLEQWEDLCEGTENPREDRGPCHEKTAMRDGVLGLRTGLGVGNGRCLEESLRQDGHEVFLPRILSHAARVWSWRPSGC